jgi:hypothetical protein
LGRGKEEASDDDDERFVRRSIEGDSDTDELSAPAPAPQVPLLRHSSLSSVLRFVDDRCKMNIHRACTRITSAGKYEEEAGRFSSRASSGKFPVAEFTKTAQRVIDSWIKRCEQNCSSHTMTFSSHKLHVSRYVSVCSLRLDYGLLPLQFVSLFIFILLLFLSFHLFDIFSVMFIQRIF